MALSSLLLSKGKVRRLSENIIDDNNGDGMLCGFAHDGAGDVMMVILIFLPAMF